MASDAAYKALKAEVEFLKRQYALLAEVVGLEDAEVQEAKFQDAIEHMKKTGSRAMLKAVLKERIAKRQKKGAAA